MLIIYPTWFIKTGKIINNFKDEGILDIFLLYFKSIIVFWIKMIANCNLFQTKGFIGEKIQE